MKGIIKPLQYRKDIQRFGPISIERPQNERGDCTSNSIFLLGMLTLDEAKRLGAVQQQYYDKYRRGESGTLEEKESVDIDYLCKLAFNKLRGEYFIQQIHIGSIRDAGRLLENGNGTLILLVGDFVSHAVVLAKTKEGRLCIIDNQQGRIYYEDTPGFDQLLRQYRSITFITEVRRDEEPKIGGKGKRTRRNKSRRNKSRRR